MSSRRRRVLAAFLTVIVSVLVALLMSEGISRLLLDPPRYHREAVALDPDLGFAGIPNIEYRVSGREGVHAFALNGDGLRGRSLPPGPAGDGVSRIAFLGDSFLVGEAVREEELVTARLELALREQGQEVEVYNLSAVDWGTGQQLLYLDSVGERLAPDTIVLAFYQGNDVVNNSLALANATTTSPGDSIRPYVVSDEGGLRVEYLDPVAAWLRRHSRIFATLEQRVGPFGSGDGAFGTRQERLKAGRMPLEELEIFRRHGSSSRWEVAWRDSFALLSALSARCDALGARLVVLAIPSVHQVKQTAESIRLAAETRAYARRPLTSMLDWNEPDRRLASFFRTSGIEGVMLLDTLRAAAEGSDQVYARDAHLGPEGHAVLSQVVLEALSGEVPEPEPATGAPVLLQRDPERYSFLDFSRESYDARLGGGWLFWNEEAGERPWGWIVGPAALVALEPGPGSLVVRGFVEPGAPLPMEVTIKLIGAPSRKGSVARPGAFALSFDVPPKAARSESGHVALLVASSTTGGFHVEAVGFEEAVD